MMHGREKSDLVAMYVIGSGMFDTPSYHDFSPARTLIGVPMQDWQRVRAGALYTDPLYVVVANRKSNAEP